MRRAAGSLLAGPPSRLRALRLPKFRRGAASGGRSAPRGARASSPSPPTACRPPPRPPRGFSTGSAAPAPALARFPSVGVGRSVAWARGKQPRRGCGGVARRSRLRRGGAGPARGVPARPPPPPRPPAGARGERARGSDREGRSWGRPRAYRVRGVRPRVPVLPLPRPGVARSGAGPRDAAASVRRCEVCWKLDKIPEEGSSGYIQAVNSVPESTLGILEGQNGET